MSYWSVWWTIAVDGRSIEFTYKLHIIAIVQLAKVPIFNRIGFITAKQKQFAVLRWKVKCPEYLKCFYGFEIYVQI